MTLLVICITCGSIPEYYSITLVYRKTTFYCSLQMTCFFQIEGLWQSCVDKGCQHHFFSSICLLCISASHFGSFPNISKFFCIIFVWWSVVSDILCYCCNCFGVPKPCPYKMADLINVCILTAPPTSCSPSLPLLQPTTP